MAPHFSKPKRPPPGGLHNADGTRKTATERLLEQARSIIEGIFGVFKKAGKIIHDIITTLTSEVAGAWKVIASSHVRCYIKCHFRYRFCSRWPFALVGHQTLKMIIFR